MSRSRPTRAVLEQAIARYAEALVADSWRGSQMPDAWPDIEKELADAKRNLDKLLNNIYFTKVGPDET
jgi:hypothetical protein